MAKIDSFTKWVIGTTLFVMISLMTIQVSVMISMNSRIGESNSAFIKFVQDNNKQHKQIINDFILTKSKVDNVYTYEIQPNTAFRKKYEKLIK